MFFFQLLSTFLVGYFFNFFSRVSTASSHLAFHFQIVIVQASASWPVECLVANVYFPRVRGHRTIRVASSHMFVSSTPDQFIISHEGLHVHNSRAAFFLLIFASKTLIFRFCSVGKQPPFDRDFEV